jgi:signal transduction histidine kinase
VEHQVRLLGLENKWQSVQGHSARYPATAPGFYTFQVKSRRRGGFWGPETSLSFQILPAWWERPWVRALAWMLPLGLLAGAMRLRFQMLKRRNVELQVKVEEATAEIRSKAETLERINQRLAQINEDKDQMLGIVAHDLRNPLHTIQLQAELLGAETAPHEAEEGSREILRISSEMQEMIRRLLDISHIETGALDLQMVAVEPRALVESVVEQHFHKAAVKDIALNVLADEALPLLWVDPFYLREVLDNLISNAVKFTAPGPPTRSVRVVLKPGAIEVSDEGPGFTEEDLAKVFGRFTRLSAQPTAGESSTGLGLNIVKTVLEAMGAQLVLESSMGAGSTFRISFPQKP